MRPLRFSLTSSLAVVGLCSGAWCSAPPATPSVPRLVIRPISGPQLLDLVRASKARTVLVNVWATWCIPCREEFPEILRIRERYRERGVEVVLVSADFDDTVGEARKFLAEHGVDFTTYVKSGGDMEFINTLDPDWSGALPATFIFDSTGKRRHSLLGKTSYDTFEGKVLDVLKDHGGER